MSVIQETIMWLTDPANYEGQGSIPQRIIEHLDFTFRAVGLAALIAIPAG